MVQQAPRPVLASTRLQEGPAPPDLSDACASRPKTSHTGFVL